MNGWPRDGELPMRMRMHIVDREVVVVPLNPEGSSQGALIIREAGALTGFCALFDQV
ncbi:hypothetical protein ACH44C_00960 [Streptomyces purpureus]|uniref:hypothetical protein n=1 Tax=Streptomyces purpureus TaxID=1951 RepID=UPI00378D4ACF